MDTIKFEEGKTYWTRSICDYDCIFQITIAKRVGKCTIVTTEGQRLRCSVYDGKEQVKPRGNYSMCPIIDASDCQPLPGSEPVKTEAPATLSELFAEGEKLFTPEQLAELKGITRALLGEKCPPMEPAKVYNLADYRSRKQA